MKPPYGARTRISTCVAIGLVDPPMFYAHCKDQHNLSTRQSEGFVKKLNRSIKPVKADDGAAIKASETILRNLRVLATDQSTETMHTADGKTMVRAFRTVTLEVTPRIAEKVAVAQTIGTLSLSLRSIADNAVELERAIASGQVNIPDGVTKAEEDMILATALNRPLDGATTYVTGGDVSRFQRRNTQPAPKAPTDSGAPARPRRAPPPTVRITRGNNTSSVQVGAGTSALLQSQSQGMRDTAEILPAAGATLVF